MKRLVIIGCKEFAQNIITQVNYSHQYQIIGYIDDIEPIGTIIDGYPILGRVDDAIDLYKQKIFDYVFMAIGYTRFDLRELNYNKLKGKIPFANIISPTACVHPTAKLGEGILLTDFVYIGMNAVLEDDVAITLRSIVNHGCYVKKHTFFSTNVVTAGNVIIGEKCFMGVNSTISDGVTICDNVWLAPGVVVTKNIKQQGHYMSTIFKLYNIG